MAAPGTTQASRGRDDLAARFVVRAAVTAPSVHNTQPWYFASRQGVITLCADTRRRLVTADPAGREAAISCGAALFNMRLAARHLGFAADVRLMPEFPRPDPLAELHWGRYARPTAYGELLYRSITRRHTHRGPFTARAPRSLIGDLPAIARQEHTGLHIVDTAQHHLLAELITAAELTQRTSPGFATELARWALPPGTRRLDGVPPAAYLAQPDGLEFVARDFSLGTGWGFPPRARPDNPHALGVVALLTTRDDQPLSWLLAGQALQRLLLHATAHSVTVAFHTQPLELPGPRELIRKEVTGGAYPQMLLRLGRTDRTLTTPRRPVSDTLIGER
ncbi:MAG TPA: hypothetical protein VMV92_23330 [Streptosporangiaceae bacterium]|nr:hypothetical protein [Streptosporangiaceae bacterium]